MSFKVLGYYLQNKRQHRSLKSFKLEKQIPNESKLYVANTIPAA